MSRPLSPLGKAYNKIDGYHAHFIAELRCYLQVECNLDIQLFVINVSCDNCPKEYIQYRIPKGLLDNQVLDAFIIGRMVERHLMKVSGKYRLGLVDHPDYWSIEPVQ